MHSKQRFISIVSAGLLAIAACGASAQESGSNSKDSKGTPSADMHGMMMKGMKEMQSMRMTGDTDKDFAMMMRHHHQQGIEMAQMELQRGKNSTMREMAQKIIDAQKKEIGEFDQWMKEHGTSGKK